MLNPQNETLKPPEESASKERLPEQRADTRISILTPACTCSSCARHLYSQTIHFRELEGFQRQKLLVYYQHEAYLLVKEAIASFDGLDPIPGKGSRKREAAHGTNGRHLCQEQTEAIQALKLRLRNVNPRDGNHNLSPQGLLATSIEHFNQVFFLGQLPKRRTGEMGSAFLQIGAIARGVSRRGHSVTRDDGQEVGSTIQLSSHHPKHFRDQGAMLSTLLHEMCHILLQRHACYRGGGQSCKDGPVCVRLCEQNHGATGHGRAWQTLAAAIEKATVRLLGHALPDGMRIDLGRAEATAKEITRTGVEVKSKREAVKAIRDSGPCWWPSQCDLDRFSDESWWRLRSLLRSRDDDIVAVRRVRRWVLEPYRSANQKFWDSRVYRIQHWPKFNEVKYLSPSNVPFDPEKVGWSNEA